MRMKQARRFLTAEWINLLMFNYAVDAALVAPFVPSGTELDTFDGQTWMSLIGFEFNRTRVFGMPVPFHRSFEEVNLRFYVRRGSRRGVVFIRELVPRFAVAAVARFAFGENYSAVPMARRLHVQSDGSVEAEYAWGSGTNRCSMRMKTQGRSYLPEEGSFGQFITEHSWGYTAQRDGGCLEYEVQHPRWQIREGKSSDFVGAAASHYGDQLAQPLAAPPHSAFFVEGSAVSVFRGTRIN
jgi:hypothetical protein